MSDLNAPQTARSQRYNDKLNLETGLATPVQKKTPRARGSASPTRAQKTAVAKRPRTTAQQNESQPSTHAPAPQNLTRPSTQVSARQNQTRLRAISSTDTGPVAPRNTVVAGNPQPSSSSSSDTDTNTDSNAESDCSELPWSPTNNGPVPSANLLAGVRPRANTDITVQLPWPVRLLFGWNFLRLYGSLIPAINEGMEPDYFTGRIYGYVDRRNPNTASTAMRLQTFFRLSTLLHLYRLFIMSTILYRIPTTLLRYQLMKWGFFPLFAYDVSLRLYVEMVVLALGWWVFNFWPLNLKAHCCRLGAAFIVQTAVWGYFQEVKELRNLIFQLHPIVWVSADVVWTILYQHTPLPIPSASTVWFIAGLDINPIFLLARLYPIIVRWGTRWNFCGHFGKETQGLCFLTPEADFPGLLQSLQESNTIIHTITDKPTSTEVLKVPYLITTPIIITETDTKTIFEGPITGGSVLLPYISERLSSMAYVKAVITTMVQTMTDRLSRRSIEIMVDPVPDSTCLWTCTGDVTGTIPSPEPCGQ